jgi:hypothetical protein
MAIPVLGIYLITSGLQKMEVMLAAIGSYAMLKLRLKTRLPAEGSVASKY